ncbi:hypothetical protein EJ02DRAFT_472864, partial [Clathrospora elynae]
MAVDLMFLTGSKSHKRQKRTTQLEEYFDDLRDDLTNASEQQLALLHDPNKSSNKSSNSNVAGDGSEVAGNSGNNSYLGDDVG